MEWDCSHMTWSISLPVITTISNTAVSISLARKKKGFQLSDRNRRYLSRQNKASSQNALCCAIHNCRVCADSVIKPPKISHLNFQSYLLFKYSFGENYQVGEIKWFWRNISLSKENVPVAELISSDAQHGWSYLEITMRLYESFSNTVPDMSMPTPPYSSYTDVAMARLLWCAASDLRFLFFYF